MHTDNQKCGHCKKNNAEFECNDCYPFIVFCGSCEILLHSHFKIRPHRFKSIQKVDDYSQPSDINKESIILNCDSHSSVKAINVCINCQKLVCIKCIETEIHQGHMIDQIPETFVNSFQKITSIISSCNEGIQKLEEFKNKSKAFSEQSKKEQESVKGTLNNFFIKLEKLISEYKIKALKMIENIKNQNEKYFNDINLNIIEMKTFLQNSVKKLENNKQAYLFLNFNQNSSLSNDILEINRTLCKLKTLEYENRMLSYYSEFPNIIQTEIEYYFNDINFLLKNQFNSNDCSFNRLDVIFNNHFNENRFRFFDFLIAQQSPINLTDFLNFKSLFLIVRKTKKLLNFESLKNLQSTSKCNIFCNCITCFNDPISQKFYYLTKNNTNNTSKEIYINEFENCTEFFNNGLRKFKLLTDTENIHPNNLFARDEIIYSGKIKENDKISSIVLRNVPCSKMQNNLSEFSLDLSDVLSEISKSDCGDLEVEFFVLLSDQLNDKQFVLFQLFNGTISFLCELIPNDRFSLGKGWILPLRFNSSSIAFINDYILYYGTYEQNSFLYISNAYDIFENSQKNIVPIYLNGIRNLKNLFYVSSEEKLIICFENSICYLHIPLCN